MAPRCCPRRCPRRVRSLGRGRRDPSPARSTGCGPGWPVAAHGFSRAPSLSLDGNSGRVMLPQHLADPVPWANFRDVPDGVAARLPSPAV